MPSTPTLIWFRLDLRLSNHTCLQKAIQLGNPIIPVFIWAPEEESPWQPGSASRWWLHQSLLQLDQSLRKINSRLIFRKGPTLEALLSLIQETKAQSVLWHRRYEPAVTQRDKQIKAKLKEKGIHAESFPGNLFFEPWEIQNQSNKPFQVFTPFWRHALKKLKSSKPASPPKHIPSPNRWPKSIPLESFQLEPKINWTEGMKASWYPGESGASTQLKAFIKKGFQNYSQDRNRPDFPSTSRLSPHLHFGEITPQQILHGIQTTLERKKSSSHTGLNSQFLAELGWREFAHHLLYHFPHTTTQPLREEFKKFPWKKSSVQLKAWQKGLTGYPLIDAGMRELWSMGWMHNRVRMVTASFLVKHLRIHWLEGARWFWDTLVDADLAQNTLGWQWTAGCGADAAPYFRIFNPVTQAEKFDPEGSYIKQWVPELFCIPKDWVHRPWESPRDLFNSDSSDPGKNYPKPIVDHSEARVSALKAYDFMRNGKLR